MFVPNNELIIARHKRLQNIVGCWCRCVLHILKRHRLKTDFNTPSQTTLSNSLCGKTENFFLKKLYMFKNYATISIDVRVSPSGLAVALKVGSPGLESRTEHFELRFLLARQLSQIRVPTPCATLWGQPLAGGVSSAREVMSFQWKMDTVVMDLPPC
jgi:hypothetical protein